MSIKLKTFELANLVRESLEVDYRLSTFYSLAEIDGLTIRVNILNILAFLVFKSFALGRVGKIGSKN